MASALAGCYGLASRKRTAGACARKLSMNLLNTILCCLLLTLAAFAQTAREKDDPQSTKLVVLEHLWNDAQVHRDERALEGMIADSFSDTEWDGEVSERGKFLADIKDPKFKPDLVTIQDVKVNLYHNTGVVTGAYHTKGSFTTANLTTISAASIPMTWILEMAAVRTRRQPHQPAEEMARRLQSEILRSELWSGR